MSEISEKLDRVLAPARLLNVGEGHAVVKTVKSIQQNSKPNPRKLFVAEGFWLATLPWVITLSVLRIPTDGRSVF